MKDVNNWARRMQGIGQYKDNELKRWHRTATLRQRIRMTEELLLLNDISRKPIRLSPLFVSLSKALEKQYAK
ncbi:MAG: hypothetical protein AB1599_03595 [Planctomycetota bacterium]